MRKVSYVVRFYFFSYFLVVVVDEFLILNAEFNINSKMMCVMILHKTQKTKKKQRKTDIRTKRN